MVVIVGIAVAALIALIAWSVVRENSELRTPSLCDEYEQFLTVGQEVRSFDSGSASVADAAEITQEYLESVRQMQEVADGRYGVELDNLEFAIDDTLRTIESVPDEADADMWAPLIDDSLDDVAIAATTVRVRIGPSCAAELN